MLCANSTSGPLVDNALVVMPPATTIADSVSVKMVPIGSLIALSAITV